jgi:hypothetical protein
VILTFSTPGGVTDDNTDTTPQPGITHPWQYGDPMSAIRQQYREQKSASELASENPCVILSLRQQRVWNFNQKKPKSFLGFLE